MPEDKDQDARLDEGEGARDGTYVTESCKAQADCLAGEEDALGVHAVHDLFEA